MRNFNNNNSFGSSRGGRGGGGGFNRDRDRNSRGFGGGGSNQMYDATCAECGNSCQVPFMPRNGKPVYCSNCFESRDNSGGDRPSRQRDSFPRPQFQERRAPGLSYNPERENKKLDMINEKLDQILKLLKSQKATMPTPVVAEVEAEVLTPDEE